jgi:hypothetical protein
MREWEKKLTPGRDVPIRIRAILRIMRQSNAAEDEGLGNMEDTRKCLRILGVTDAEIKAADVWDCSWKFSPVDLEVESEDVKE